MERLKESGEFVPPRLSTLERTLEAVLELGKARVFADTWNLELFSSCDTCLAQRRERLHAMNLTQRIMPPIRCLVCDTT